MAKVALIVGHGDRPDGTHDPGAVGGGWTEQTAGQHVGLGAAEVMEAAGVTVDPNETLYPESDPNYIKSTADANDAGADLVLSIHHDWIKAPTGAFALWVSDAGRRFGIDIEQAVGAAGFELRTYTANPRTDLYLLKNTHAPAVIFECGRIGEDALDTEEELRAMGRAIGRGVLDHLGIEHQEDEVTPQDKQDIAEAVVKKLSASDTLIEAAAKGAYRQRTNLGSLEASVDDWVSGEPMQMHVLHRRVRFDVDRIVAIVQALAADNDEILAAIADAEGLTVEEARSAISAALANTRLTVDDPDA